MTFSSLWLLHYADCSLIGPWSSLTNHRISFTIDSKIGFFWSHLRFRDHKWIGVGACIRGDSHRSILIDSRFDRSPVSATNANDVPTINCAKTASGVDEQVRTTRTNTKWRSTLVMWVKSHFYISLIDLLIFPIFRSHLRNSWPIRFISHYNAYRQQTRNHRRYLPNDRSDHSSYRISCQPRPQRYGKYGFVLFVRVVRWSHCDAIRF